MHSSKTKSQAKQYRKKGFSIKEISETLGIAQSTISIWLKDVTLPEAAIQRLNRKVLAARKKGIKTKKESIQKDVSYIQQRINTELVPIEFGKFEKKILCSLLYWCEGNKQGHSVAFTNSDATMIQLFMTLLRESFKLDESKFRCLVHIHDYHSEAAVLEYWSAITQVPVSQFSKSYRKSNTGKSKNIQYMGTLRVRYYDVQIARELKLLYNSVSAKLLNRPIM